MKSTNGIEGPKGVGALGVERGSGDDTARAKWPMQHGQRERWEGVWGWGGSTGMEWMEVIREGA